MANDSYRFKTTNNVEFANNKKKSRIWLLIYNDLNQDRRDSASNIFPL